MLKTFHPPIGPSPGTAYNPEVRLLETSFGDGYTQAAPAGLNHIKNTLNLNWDGLTYEEMEEIYGFFLRHAGYIPFYYRPFGMLDQHKWTCKEFRKSTVDGIWQVSAKLVESFTNET